MIITFKILEGIIILFMLGEPLHLTKPRLNIKRSCSCPWFLKKVICKHAWTFGNMKELGLFEPKYYTFGNMDYYTKNK